MNPLVEIFFDLEAAVDDEEEEEEEEEAGGGETGMGNFIAKDDEEDEEGNEWPEFAQHDSLETAAQLEEIASEYNARAAKEYHLEPSAGHDVDVDPAILKMREEVRVNRRNLALWSFKVPPHKMDYFTARFASLRQNTLYASWFDKAFILHYLPGRIFVFAPAKTIEALGTLAGIASKPWQVPRSEWDASDASPLFIPWSRRRINVQSWVRISKEKLSYYGDLAYVVGSAETTDGLLVAVVPRVNHTPGHDEKETRKRKGKQSVSSKTKERKLALFEPDAMTVRFGSAVKAIPIREKEDFFDILKDKFLKQFSDLARFNWANLPIINGDPIYQFDGQLFYRGLLLLPLSAFATVDVVTVPPSHEIILFAQSCIDPPRIDSLLSQLHWQAGDRVSRGDDLYQLEDVQLHDGSVLASPLRSQSTKMEKIPVEELQQRFAVGDYVIVLAGICEGMTGSVLSKGHGTLDILTNDDGTYISVRSQWVATCLTPPMPVVGPSDHLMVGDLLRVVDGPYRLRQGALVQKLNKGAGLQLKDLVTKESFSVELNCVEKVAFTQDPFRLIKEAAKPWDTKGRVLPGDFIRVLQGDLTGKEGFVKDFNDSHELVVEETSKDPSQPLVISQGGNAKAQERASFTVAAKMAFCYDRLQPYDVVKVIYGSATGRRGHVLDIRPDGYLTIKATGCNMFLNIYRDSVVIHDRLCVGDSVVVKEGPVESRRGIVTQIRPDGLVTFERDYGHVSSNVACQAHILTLEKIVNPTFSRAVRHKALGKQVAVIIGVDKGLTGYVYGHNYIQNTFLVHLVNTRRKNFASTDLVYVSNRQSLDESLDGNPDCDPLVIATLPTTPPRQTTPMPDGPLVAPDDPDYETWAVSPDDIVPVDDDWPMAPAEPVPDCFLTDPIWQCIHGKHIRVALGPKFGSGNRMGYTKIPLEFDNPRRPSKVAMYWTDNKSKWQHDYLTFDDLKPGRPSKKGVEVVVLHGDYKGHTFNVNKVTRSDDTVTLSTTSNAIVLPATHVCMVESHLERGCSCSKLQ